MPTPEEELQATRKKRSILLLASGSVILILPLLGLVYIKLNEAKAVPAPSASVMFDRREQGEEKVNITQTVSIVNPGAAPSSLPVAGGPTMVQSGTSSLDFVKGGGFPDKAAADKAAAEKAAAAAAAAAKAAEKSEPILPPEPAAKTTAKKKEKKMFNSPKLQGTKSISSFKANTKATAAPAAKGAAAAEAKGGGMEDMLKNVPGGVDNPEVQKYLKSRGK